MSDREKQFSDWLDNKSSNQENTQADEVFDVEDEWQQRATTAQYVAHQASITPEQSVPHWDRATAFTDDKQPWWQWSGLPAMSMAFSFLAIGLVLFKVELVIQPEGILLSFAGNQQVAEQNKVAQLVDVKLKEFAAEQQVVLANYATDFTAKQQGSNLQLASYLLGATRQERKEDMNDFISYINDQRKDEQLDQKIKFQQLERAINYQKINSDSSGYKVKPANWTTEE